MSIKPVMNSGSGPPLVDENLLLASVEIIPGRFYFMTLKSHARPKFTQWSHFFTVDEELKYDPFYDDFGPLNLAQLYKYCKKIEDKLKSTILESKKIVHYTSFDPKKRVNSAYLVGSYAILYLNRDPLEVFEKLNQGTFYTDFRDASVGYAVYTISLRDCLHAVAKAKECRFFDLNDFAYTEYLHYETVENGDLNWVVPEKFLAFAGPQSLGYKSPSKWRHTLVTCHTPESYLNYFKALNVTTIVRLNNKCYDALKFTEAGLQHHDLIFIDGGTPSDDLVHKFLKIAEEAPGAIAVHCKAGLGRTGSMIGCYIMKWYRFTAREAIAWLRICRPASIIGYQQQWLESKQVEMWMAGMNLQRPYHRFGVYSFQHGRAPPLKAPTPSPEKTSMDSLSGITSQVTTMNINKTDINKNVPVDQPHEISQGDHLQKIKMERQPSTKTQNKAQRCSWPMTLTAAPGKRGPGSWPTGNLSAKRGTSLGKVAPSKRAAERVVTRKKIGSADDNGRVLPPPVPVQVVPGAVVTPLRRSQRILEPRVCKSVILR